jgi:hypothetical protein
MMSWVSLTTPNGYGECALDDVVAIVEYTTAWLREHKLEPELSEERWVRQILHYILARHRGAEPWAVSTTHVPDKPVGWTEQDEKYWDDWVNYTLSLREWEKRVLRPVFGSDQRLWEVNIDDWRTEIHTFLPLWIRRKMSIVDAMYPQGEEEEEPETDARGSLLRMRDPKAIDPYILEQEEKKYRGRR